MKKNANKYDEQQILDGIKKNDSKVFEYLVCKLKHPVCNFILNNSGTCTEAEDNFHDTWTIVIGKIHNDEYKPENFAGFFNKISRIIWLKELIRKKKEKLIGELPETILNDIYLLKEYKEFFTEDLSDIVNKALLKLDMKCQEILTLAYKEKLKHKEIAKKIDYPVKNIKVKLYNCIEELFETIIKDTNVLGEYQEILTNDLYDIVNKAMLKLDIKCKEILTLAYKENLKHKEIAEEMKYSVDFCRVKIYRCKNKLLEILMVDLISKN
ncbi:sigma-70 family RNA polymerase sigma factor [Fulvivirgaceae bacterium BMA12]|uniref:Sigma-70 family RNA polymerase sigma factor n=1 Tax=Agaribacillus aureus TaxID=3051825 RepID=A0ABT8LAA1_9BACT|nr:sigma-70 family RNA polymerase sigma factor [Fulvivirgaceae bacterium BMA12]